MTSKAHHSDEEYINQPSTRKTNIPKDTISGFYKDNFVIVNFLYNSKFPKEQIKTVYAQVLDIHENAEPNKFTLKYLK